MTTATSATKGVATEGVQSTREGTKIVQPSRRKNQISVLSPLRYPGGKRRLSLYIEEVLKLNKIHPKLLVEPFAGGASVSLHLLSNGAVEKIVLGEKDPLVAAFWKTALFETDWFIEQIEEMPVTIDQWHKYKRNTPTTTKEKALTCLFLNRTSFSGILHKGAGPIGGLEQRSEYTIDCRFPKDRLIRRLEVLKGLREKVLFVKEGDWKLTVETVMEDDSYCAKDVFYYLDPPFYHKANKLYNFCFTNADHIDLCHFLGEVKDSHWLVSYDPAKEILDMCKYNGYSTNTVGVLYTPSNTSTRKATEIIITNLEHLPNMTQLYNTKCKKG